MTHLTIIQIYQVKDTNLNMWSVQISQNQDKRRSEKIEILNSSCSKLCVEFIFRFVLTRN